MPGTLAFECLDVKSCEISSTGVGAHGPMVAGTDNHDVARKTRKTPCRNGSPDDFQTPIFALDPILPLINRELPVWDPSCGRGNLVAAFRRNGFWAIGSDVEVFSNSVAEPDMIGDFLHTGWEAVCNHVPMLDPGMIPTIVTNPPYSVKDEFISRCYKLGCPFALLMPITAIEGRKRQPLYRKYGVHIIALPKRVNFETPSGEGSGAWFPVAWYTYKLQMPYYGMLSTIEFWQAGDADSKEWGVHNKDLFSLR